MTRLKALSPDEATGKTKELFNAVHSKYGVVPNMIQTMGNSSAVLEAYLNFSGALGGGTLNAKTGKLIAMAVSESNSCNVSHRPSTLILLVNKDYMAGSQF